MFANTLLVSLLAASSAFAHYTLDFPTSRGFVSADEVKFCGGFNSPSSTRTSFPLSGNAPVQWDSHHAIGTVGIYISTKENPTNWTDFSTTMAKNWFTGPNGAACANIDMGMLNMNLTNGSLVTIQMVANGGDGNLYQCADLVLIEGYSVPENVTCANDVSLAANATATATPSLGASAAASSGVMSMTSSGAAAASSAASTGSTSAAFKAEVALGSLVAVGLAAVGLVL